MCNYKLTVTLEKSVDVVDGGGWVTGMTWRKAGIDWPVDGIPSIDKPIITINLAIN